MISGTTRIDGRGYNRNDPMPENASIGPCGASLPGRNNQARPGWNPNRPATTGTAADQSAVPARPCRPTCRGAGVPEFFKVLIA